MRVLVVGSGGREHALCWSLSGSPLLTKLWCAPGNPGTAELAENVPIAAIDIAALVGFAGEHGVDLVVPGPEAPLVAGLADALERAEIGHFVVVVKIEPRQRHAGERRQVRHLEALAKLQLDQFHAAQG